MEPTVTIDGVDKRFGTRLALDGVGFGFGAGITGLLGPNGAGKTTLIRCLATVLAPSSGEIRVLGLDPRIPRQRTEIRRRLGYLPQEPGFFTNFTAAEFVDYVAILKEMADTGYRRAEVSRVLDAVDLADRSTTKIRNLSGGMRKLLALAQALLGDPQLLLLDEPTSGLDPEHRLRFRDRLSRLAESRTVLLSTHQTEDVAAMCEKVIVLHEGRGKFEGPPSRLSGMADGHVWLSPHRPENALLSWRNPEGLYRSIGDPPPDTELVAPTVEDGYLMLLGSQQEVAA